MHTGNQPPFAGGLAQQGLGEVEAGGEGEVGLPDRHLEQRAGAHHRAGGGGRRGRELERSALADEVAAGGTPPDLVVWPEGATDLDPLDVIPDPDAKSSRAYMTSTYWLSTSIGAPGRSDRMRIAARRPSSV